MSSSSNTTTNVINPKPCNYNCGIESIGILQVVNILKYSQRRNIFVLIVQIINQVGNEFRLYTINQLITIDLQNNLNLKQVIV